LHAFSAYLSEYGCLNPNGARTWEEAGSLFSSDMSTIWSGGIAFNYFPASSAAGQFGMVTISDDNSTVTTSQDYDNLKEQYGKVSPPTTPSQSSAPSATYAACPAQNSDLLASTTLPPTPNDGACQCLEKSLSCQFKPPTKNETLNLLVIGQLLDYGCSLLGQNGGSCNDIAASGSAGAYGIASSCDPGECSELSYRSSSLVSCRDIATKLSYVFTQYYENQKKNAAACDFSGNATVNAAGPAASSAVSTCMASATGTSVPSLVATSSSSVRSSSTSSPTSSGGSGNNGAVSLAMPSGVFGVVTMVAVSVLAGAMTLA
jgi:1,3-beta-glucanosyltransferase GAS1